MKILHNFIIALIALLVFSSLNPVGAGFVPGTIQKKTATSQIQQCNSSDQDIRTGYLCNVPSNECKTY